MLQFFRNFFKSKLGLGVTLVFLALIAFAFASSDVSNNGAFGGVAGGERVAVVGDHKVGTAELSRAASNALDRVRQDDPTVSMPTFIANGGLQQVMDQLIDRYAIMSFAEEHGLRAGDNLINSEIRQIPAFRGPDGNFSDDAYRQALASQGLSDTMVRKDFAIGLLAQQIVDPASFGAAMPKALAVRYAQLFKERRQGAIGFLPAEAFAPKEDPTDAQLGKYYTEHRDKFIRPERRVIRYASFGDDAVTDSIEPTDAEIRQRYDRDKTKYAASEDRSFTQLIVPTEQAAQSIRDRVAGGASFEQVAREAGLRTSKVGPVNQGKIASDSSQAVAKAYFSAARGAMTEPAQSPLGWHVAQVDSVERREARSLADARGEIAEALRHEKTQHALTDLAASIEERIDGGETTADIAKEYGLNLQSTRPVTADGRVYQSAGETVPQIVQPALATAFQMEEGEAQVAEVARGETFMLFDVSTITPSAAAPLKEIRDQVVASWRQTEGSAKAKAAADRVIAKLGKGTALSAALSGEETRLPPVQSVNLTREDLARQQNQRVPPPLALLFSMAQGTSKRLAAPGDMGWYVVDLDKIELGDIDKDDPLIAQAQTELGSVLGQEYVSQLLAAMRNEVGAERNPAAIAAVRRQLTGER